MAPSPNSRILVFDGWEGCRQTLLKAVTSWLPNSWPGAPPRISVLFENLCCTVFNH